MKKVYFLFFIAFMSAGLKAQNCPCLTPTVIASTGGFASSANSSLSYTVGEMTMVQTFSANGNILTQGFQQPDTGKITGLIELSKGDFGSFVVYPNPSVDNTWFGFELPEAGRVVITLYDELGQKISDLFQTNYQSGKIIEQTNVSKLAAGTYLVTLIFTSNVDGKTHMNTLKLQVIR